MKSDHRPHPIQMPAMIDPLRRQAIATGAAFLGLLTAACASTGNAQTNSPTPSQRERLRERLRQRRAAQKGANEQAPPPDTPQGGISHPYALPGAFAVEQLEDVWVNAARNDRVIPWRAYLPAQKTNAPVVIYSHGGGGTRGSGAIYGQHLASHGIASLHLQHAGSDRDAFRTDPQQISAAARDPKAGLPRFEDVGYAAARLAQAPGALLGRIDAARMGIAGHSFGAITTQIIAGQMVSGFGQGLALPNLLGAFALSPSPPRAGYGDAETAFTDMLLPIFHLTGTKDDAPNGDFDAPARRIPFDRTNNVDQYLLILEGANHFTFGGEANPRLGPRDFGYPGLPRHHQLILVAAAAFWLERFEKDSKAREFLRAGDYAALLGAGDVFERKEAKK